MNKEFIPYEQALELKELGFNYQCFAAQKGNLIDYGSEMYDFIYNTDLTDKTEGWVALPLFQQSFRFFRNKYELHHRIHKYDNEVFTFAILDKDFYTFYDEYKTYEKAELACLKKLIEIAKINKP